MAWNDDDEEFSASDHRYFEHADHGKKEKREEKAREKGELLKLQRDILRNQVVPGDAQDDEDETQIDEKDEDVDTFKTQTLKEKEEDAKQTKANPNPDDLLAQQQATPDVSEEETQSEPG